MDNRAIFAFLRTDLSPGISGGFLTTLVADSSLSARRLEPFDVNGDGIPELFVTTPGGVSLLSGTRGNIYTEVDFFSNSSLTSPSSLALVHLQDVEVLQIWVTDEGEELVTVFELNLNEDPASSVDAGPDPVATLGALLADGNAAGSAGSIANAVFLALFGVVLDDGGPLGEGTELDDSGVLDSPGSGGGLNNTLSQILAFAVNVVDSAVQLVHSFMADIHNFLEATLESEDADRLEELGVRWMSIVLGPLGPWLLAVDLAWSLYGHESDAESEFVEADEDNAGSPIEEQAERIGRLLQVLFPWLPVGEDSGHLSQEHEPADSEASAEAETTIPESTDETPGTDGLSPALPPAGAQRLDTDDASDGETLETETALEPEFPPSRDSASAAQVTLGLAAGISGLRTVSRFANRKRQAYAAVDLLFERKANLHERIVL